MKALTGLLAGFGVLGVLTAFGLGLFMVGVSIYGLVLAFKASILIGILALIVEPSPTIIGLIALFANINLAQKLADFLFN